MRVRLAVPFAGIGLLLGVALFGGHPVPLAIADEAQGAKAGKPVALDPQLQRSFGKQATVIVFLGIGCPVSNAYIPHLNELAKKHSKSLVNGEPTESKLALGSKGVLRYEVSARGRAVARNRLAR